MESQKFRYARAKNFLCFGEAGIELFFEDYGPIILVKGINKDTGSDEAPASNGAGKCFGINTPIMMFNGEVKPVQEVKAGDLVMGPDSKPRLVTGKNSGREQLYKVVPAKGAPYVVNESHILVLKSGDRKDKHYRNHFSRVDDHYEISVKDYLAQSSAFHNITKGYRVGVDFDEKTVPIDPYCLGLWLGDGSSHCVALTTQDDEVVQAWEELATNFGLSIRKTKKKKCPTYTIYANFREHPGIDAIEAYKLRVKHKLTYPKIRNLINSIFERCVSLVSIKKWIAATQKWVEDGGDLDKITCDFSCENWRDYEYQNPILNRLKSLNLIRNKHVPHIYLTNTRNIRLQILAGLLDSDGSMSNGGFDFINKNQTLAENVVFLARSLGLSAYMKRCYKKSQTGKKAPYYRVSIYGDCSVIPTRIPRKMAPVRVINKDPLKVGLKVCPLEVGDYYGFEVDGDGLFLLGDFTVVHNSSLQDILSYALYGKTVKKPKQLTHNVVVNAASGGKGLEVEVQFGNYRIVRRGGPSSLRLWESKDHIWDKETEITRGTMKATQEQVEGIIGLNHQAFCNVVVFDDSKSNCFLESDAATKRTIVENLLGLDQYREYHLQAKEALKEAKNKVKLVSTEYERIQIELDACAERITKIETQEKTWKKTKIVEATDVMNRLKAKQELLEKLDGGTEVATYQQAQAKIEELQTTLEESRIKKENASVALADARKQLEESKVAKDKLNLELQSYNAKIQSTESDMLRSQNLVDSLEKLDAGATCPVCHGTIDRSNYENVLNHELHILEECNEKVSIDKESSNILLAEFKKHQATIAKLQQLETEASKKLTQFEQKIQADTIEMNRLAKLPKPNLDAKQQVLESEIMELKKQVKSKREELEGGGPYKEIYESAVKEKADKQVENEAKVLVLREAESEVPYCEFWVTAFGDTGIRKFVVDGIIPALNSRIAYWMQHLYKGQIELKFDNEFNETITRNDVDANYHAMSNGETQRINLSIPQSFAYVMTLNCGSCPSVVFLDEITGGGIDKAGVEGVFNMICELAKERQVFVTTHNEYLLNMLDGCETLTLVKENDVSRLI